MILSVFSGFVYAEEEHPARVVGREIKNNPLVKKALTLDYDTKFKLATAVFFLKDEQPAIVSGLFNAVEKSKDLNTRLKNNGVTESVANTILSKIKIELQLVLKDSNDKIIKILNKFDTKIKVAIEIEEKDGNPDLLAVFYINEETGALKFVGGKIKDNKIIMTTGHYSKFTVIEYDKSFSDIEDHWSKDYVKSMIAKHVIDGFEDNTYRPEDKLTRAQFAKLLVEVLELDIISYKEDFKDVSTAHWAKDYIATAKQQGIIAGYEDGTFKPEQSINRSEMAAMITNALELNKDSNPASLKKFKDAQEVPTWAVEYMVPVVEEGLLIGSNGMLNPLGSVTRAEAATITYRVYNR